MASLKELQTALKNTQQDIAGLEWFSGGLPREWMRKATLDRIAELKSVVAKLEAQIAASKARKKTKNSNRPTAPRT